LELSVVVSGNSAQIVGERAEKVVIRWVKARRVDAKESPSRVPEWPLSSCLHCVVGHCHAEESLHVAEPGFFAGLIPPDGEIVSKMSKQAIGLIISEGQSLR
jgi:hypothetical protein